ncbi:hypothetical protein ACQWFX_26895, partial [Salmonella enterica subsp. enterica serovar Infantis]
FTSVKLVYFNYSPRVMLLELMQQTLQRLGQIMAPSELNGVVVIRVLGRLSVSEGHPLLTVVFSILLGMTLECLSIDQ